MERTLVLIRHAKSAWENVGLNDFDRPLNDRGKRDAPNMAKRLKQRHPGIDIFFSSPAKRARKTAEVFAEHLEYDEKKIEWVQSLYLAPAPIFYEVVNSASDEHRHLAIVAHNPGITEFANELTQLKVDNIPTCGIFAVRADIDSWSGFATAEKQFLFFDYPKAGS